MSVKIEPPKDAIGNELKKGDYVSMFPNKQMIGVVQEAQAGGLATSQGVAPTRVRVTFDINLAQIPGVFFSTLAKVVNPEMQNILDHIVDTEH